MTSLNRELTIQIQDIGCVCSGDQLESEIRRLEGVKDCTFDFATDRLTLVGSVDREALIIRLRDLGYEVHPSLSQLINQTNTTRRLSFGQYIWRRRETRLALLGVFLILPGIIFSELMGIQNTLVNLSSIGALIAAGIPIARSAWRTLRINREININTLMTVASVGAVVIGAYTEAGMVMVLFAIGEALESYTALRARDSIRSLMEVIPDRATVLRQHGEDIHEERVKVDTLHVGDLILVKPGERVPMDGRVVKGTSHVNQAPITGESRLESKTVGSEVFAGSINGAGSLRIEVTRSVEDNTISRMIMLVEEAQGRKAPTQRFVDRFAKVYTPAVVVLAALVAVVPPLVFNQPFLNTTPGTFGWLYRGLALLVVACPCALVISTPVSIISAISNAARNGVLIKGGVYLEVLSRVKAIAFDKTGTLTEGRPSVVVARSIDCAPLSKASPSLDTNGRCDGCDDLVALASAVERNSEHPLAQAVVRESRRRGVGSKYPAAEEVTALPGYGVIGNVVGRQVTVGSHEYFDDTIPHPQAHCVEAYEYEGDGYSTIMVSEDGVYSGVIAVADNLRERSREAIKMLKDLGFKVLVMITGDNAAVAQSVAERLGMTEAIAEMLPQEKVTAIESLKEDYGPVAMVGDGINDAPALARADVGIALGGALGGTAQAMETADITLMSGDLRQVPYIVRLSQATTRNLRTNVILSLGVKFAFLVLVLFGLGTMWMAVLADMGTTLLVTFNGMRLLHRPASADFHG